MGRRFKDLQTPEQQYAARQAQSSTGSAAPSTPVRPAANAQWRAMTPHQQAAHLARLDGRESDAREWERYEAEASTPAPKKRGWFR
ncbi:hypothetical protein AB0N07_39565 [Streptomyces sp. NPDC051172]|uniref:hypothetical protein n=1 Tax=Streptomyces sp. NPDC051172 TaxID=3155796 RepID=UPI00342DDF2E